MRTSWRDLLEADLASIEHVDKPYQTAKSLHRLIDVRQRGTRTTMPSGLA